jgi:hypothetical protein
MRGRIWSAENTNRLIALYGEGHTTAVIAARLSLTQDAVIGKANRLGLPPRRKPSASGLKIIQLASSPSHLVRQLAGALADVHLRKAGRLPSIGAESCGPRQWSDREYDIARSMQLKGIGNVDIARRLGRTVHAVDRAVGCECATKGRNAVTDRPDHLKTSNRSAAKHHRGEATSPPTDQRTSAAA